MRVSLPPGALSGEVASAPSGRDRPLGPSARRHGSQPTGRRSSPGSVPRLAGWGSLQNPSAVARTKETTMPLGKKNTPTQPPGRPGNAPPPVDEPTEPTPPLPPKPDQQGAALRTATGTPVGPDGGEQIDPEERDRAQQSAHLTTSTGARLRETDHSLKAGRRGPVLLQDHHLREKITHFDHERIPERVVHARGAAAHGVFEGYGTAESVTKAGFLAKGKFTPVFTRFSTVVGSRGSMDTARDTRGFATKLYTDEGTFDLVANNIPVFFIQDGIKFPDVVHAVKPHPDREIPQAQSAHDTFWDFVSLHTEAQHHTPWLIGDRGLAPGPLYTGDRPLSRPANHPPGCFTQDGRQFPGLVRAVNPHPDRAIPQAQSAHDTFWDFVALHTEAQHHTLWFMGDRGIPRSYRMMEGFGIHTFRLENADGTTSLAKFHWKPVLGVHSLTWEEAQLLGGADPDFHRRDLADAIESGAHPAWELGIQVFPDEPEQEFEGIDLLDPTKIVPEELAPVQPIGKLTLNRNPRNYFAETEQVAFHPGNLVPGIDVTDDPLLQVRLFSYLDTQLIRLGGPNFNQLPINRPHAPVNDMFRDGYGQQADHAGVAPYRPNSLDGGS